MTGVETAASVLMIIKELVPIIEELLAHLPHQTTMPSQQRLELAKRMIEYADSAS
jgi:hypothetical protein